MRDKWRDVTIEEIASKIAMGPFGSSIKVETFVSEGVPVISGQHLRGSRLDETSGFNFINEEHADRLKNANVQKGDVIFTHAGNIGQVACIPDNSLYDRYVISQRQFYMRCDLEQVFPEFIALYFKTRDGQHKLLANSSQVGVPSIAQPSSYLRSIPLPLPSLSEQREIIRILGALDDKIELNGRMNETLEEIARAIFKSWFVDFDPVRAKSQGRKPYGMSDEAAALFPDSFENSELGEVPTGWRVGVVGEYFKVTMGQSPPGDTYNESGVGMPFYQGRRDFGWRYPSLRVYCTSEKKRTANRDDTLVSVRAPVGDTNMAAGHCCIGRGVAAVRHLSDSRSYTYYAMGTLKPHFDQFDDQGTVFGSINKQGFLNLSFVHPPDELVRDFERLVFPIDEQIENNSKQIATLTRLRDNLLPRLMSGEVRVTEAEWQMEEVL